MQVGTTAGRVLRLSAVLCLWPALASAQAREAWVEQEAVAVRASIAATARVFDVDVASVRAHLHGNARAVVLPLAKGGFAEFAIEDSGTMHPELAAKFPELRSFRGQDAEGRRLRLDVSPAGINAMIFADDGVQVIRPRGIGQSEHESFARADYIGPRVAFRCEVEHVSPLDKALHGSGDHGHTTGTAKTVTGNVKRTYRIAVAATGEYTAFHGGTVVLGLAAVVTTMNRVNEVYETDLSVRVQLIPNNDLIVYTNAGTDPYTNGDPGWMIDENVSNLNSVIGSANYDVGHVVGTNSGGLAGLGVICGAGKASGVTGSGAPVGDPFDIDYVAHELGHQFGGNHTFNGNAGACFGNRAASAAYEPGSGSTIMAYAGICDNQDLQPNSDPYFHARSLQEIQNRLTNTNCAVQSPADNAAPVLAPLQAHTIPARTPFALQADGSDADGDVLTYTWEQYDLGGAQSGTNPSSTATTGPLVRSFVPTPDPERVVPRLSTLLGGPAARGEVLPAVTRSMVFRVTARDNHAGGGATQSADVTLSVRDTGMAFAITAPNTAATEWRCGADVPVSWNVAGTTANQINCAAVDLDLSQDGGVTFGHALASAVPNTGSATVRVPFAVSDDIRIRARCSNNIFFDISDANFLLVDDGPPTAIDTTVADSLEDAPRTIMPAEFGGAIPAGAHLYSVTGESGGSVSIVDGNVEFVPDADFNGTARFSYSVDDDCARGPVPLDEATVEFVVSPVNDAPVLAPLDDVDAAGGAGTVITRAAFASVSDFGAPDEAGQQVLAYVVTPVDAAAAALVSDIGIDSDGTLTLTLSGEPGSGDFDVVVRDDGGTAGGGVDTSAPQRFTLVVLSSVDVRVTKDNGRNRLLPDEQIAYTITVENDGAVDAPSVRVLDAVPAGLRNVTWLCSGAPCTQAAGSGDIDMTLALPANAVVTFTVQATVDAAVGATVENRVDAIVEESETVVEMTPEDNVAVDSDIIVSRAIFGDGFEASSEE